MREIRAGLRSAVWARQRWRLTRKLLPFPQGGHVCCEHGCDCLDAGQREPGELYVCSQLADEILVDAGISCRETFKRMKSLGEDPQALSAILITHEHSDHVYGLATLAKKLSVPVFMTGATHAAWARAMRDGTANGRNWRSWSALSRGIASRLATSR